jgi:outer membrane immunogenic protein
VRNYLVREALDNPLAHCRKLDWPYSFGWNAVFWRLAMKRKGYLLATASGVAVAATGGAQAADMPIKAPMPAPVAASWAGWYVGLSAGANWQHATNYANGGPAYGTLGSPTTTTTGFIGGAQIGYNMQDGNFVYGWEGDISGLTGTGNASNKYGKNFSNRIRWLSTLRARAGLAVGNTMAYMTGGLAIGGVQNSFTELGCSTCSKSTSKTRIGWAVGGGIEHILWNSNLTVAMEALFVDLGKSSATGVNPTKISHFSNQAVIGRLKLNYKF